jgi:hypothetical protein
MQYAFNVAGHAAFLRADAVYVGSFFSDVPESPNLKEGGDAAVNTTARTALKDLKLERYAHSFTDRDSYTFRGIDNQLGDDFGYRLRPRTIGFQLECPF